MTDLFREIFQSLSNNKVRTALTGLAVAWGIFMLIVLLGMSRGVSNAFKSRVSLEDSRSLNVYGGFTTKPYRGYSEGRRVMPEAADIEAVERSDRVHVEQVSAVKTIDTAVVSTGRDYISDAIYGHFPS